VVARRPRSLTTQDEAVWAEFVRSVAPLPGRHVPPLPSAPIDEQAAPSPPATPPAPGAGSARRAHPPPALTVGETPSGVDRASWQRFRSGKLVAQRTLDLHGRTAQHAFHALDAFLHAAQADGLRCVEVITGRGGRDGGSGVIRRELPHWLNLPHLRALVLAAAHPHAANPGAVRLLLRRRR
jgi:DNA-nicking Smr family endonuclease